MGGSMVLFVMSLPLLPFRFGGASSLLRERGLVAYEVCFPCWRLTLLPFFGIACHINSVVYFGDRSTHPYLRLSNMGWRHSLIGLVLYGINPDDFRYGVGVSMAVGSKTDTGDFREIFFLCRSFSGRSKSQSFYCAKVVCCDIWWCPVDTSVGRSTRPPQTLTI